MGEPKENQENRSCAVQSELFSAVAMHTDRYAARSVCSHRIVKRGASRCDLFKSQEYGKVYLRRKAEEEYTNRKHSLY